MRTIELVTRVAAPAARVFDLELDMDAHAASWPRSRETATATAAGRVLGPGDVVTFRARHLGLPWTMTSRVTAYDRPSRFVDEQVRGPFAALRHEHVFVDEGDGTTTMVDRMTIVAPLGPVGRLAEATLLGPYLRRLLRRRASVIRELAERGDS